MKRFLKWHIKEGIRFYNWGYPVTKMIRWRINLPIRLHNRLFQKKSQYLCLNSRVGVANAKYK